MSRPIPAEAVKLIMSLFSSEDALINEALEILTRSYGEVDFISPLFSFAYTDYYTKEMGIDLVRRFVSFTGLIPPEVLPDVKLATNVLEENYMQAGKRKLNIDPGYIAQAHLILATGKGYTHRPYLRDGIYADLTLIFQGGSFRGLPWTYPDYGSSEVICMLGKMRKKYLEQLKKLRNIQS
jgi:hypothetical protein